MNSNNEIFCFDTSAFVRIHRFYPISLIPDLWSFLEEMLKKHIIISHELVFNEIVPKSGTMDELAKWVSRFKANFKSITKRQTELVPKILGSFPKIIDPESEKDQADPWLIALLLEIMEQYGLFGDDSIYVLVSTESERSPHKIPAVCSKYNIRHMNLFQFYKFNEFKFSVTRK
jgi:hypothetical protein